MNRKVSPEEYRIPESNVVCKIKSQEIEIIVQKLEEKEARELAKKKQKPKVENAGPK